MRVKLKVDMNVLMDAMRELNNLEKQIKEQCPKFNYVVLDIMKANICLQTVVGHLNTMEI